MFESNDTFVEEAVKSKETIDQKIKKYACLVLTIISLLAAILGIFALVSSILFIALLILTIILMGNKNIEYEYDFTNGSLEIAKIIDNSKRKKVLSVEHSEIRLIAAEGTNEFLKYDNVKLKIFDCSAHREDVKTYVLVAHDDKKNEDYKVFFNPSDKLIAAMKRYNKREIYD